MLEAGSDALVRDGESIRLLLFFGIFFLMFWVEGVVPRRKWRVSRLRRLGIHSLFALFNFLVIRATVAVPLIVWSQFVADHGWGLSRLLAFRGWMEVVLSLIVLDALNYWWHRWNHSVGWLWRFHRVHHADTHLDVTTSLRFHVGEYLISAGVKAVWIFLWGPTALAFVVFEVLITAFSQFHHSNIGFSKKTEKWLRSWIMTPELHAGHHAVERRTRDANYSTILTVWDRWFGSLRVPRAQELSRLGLPKGRRRDLDPLRALWEPFSNH